MMSIGMWSELPSRSLTITATTAFWSEPLIANLRPQIPDDDLDEFDATVTQWREAMEFAKHLKEGEEPSTTPDLSWKERLDATIQRITESK